MTKITVPALKQTQSRLIASRASMKFPKSGYRNKTVQEKLYLLANFGRWFRRSGRSVSQIDEFLTKAFVKHKQRVHAGGLRTLQQFLDHLREREVIPDRKLVRDQSPLADIMGKYEKYLRSERGLVTTTILDHQSYARKFLGERFPEGRFLLKEMKASDISGFVLRHSHSMSIGRARSMTTALRSFFRFLFQKGDLGADLAASVPSVAGWRQSTVPKYLTPGEVKRVLKTCDRRTAIGRRDYAILLLLARLGLRAGEVVALRLEDIDWRAGEILVRGKGLLHDRMPCLQRWAKLWHPNLRRDRPACQTRRVSFA